MLPPAAPQKDAIRFWSTGENEAQYNKPSSLVVSITGTEMFSINQTVKKIKIKAFILNGRLTIDACASIERSEDASFSTRQN